MTLALTASVGSQVKCLEVFHGLKKVLQSTCHVVMHTINTSSIRFWSAQKYTPETQEQFQALQIGAIG